MKKIVIFYLCHSGKTKETAEKIKRLTDADLFQVMPNDDVHKNNKLPFTITQKGSLDKSLLNKTRLIPDVSGYDLVLFGYPNWWESLPEPMKILISELKLADKEVAAFCTHEGSRSRKKSTALEQYCPDSIILEGVYLRNDGSNETDHLLSDWVDSLLDSNI